MAKDDHGVWSVTIRRDAKGAQEYRFWDDGSNEIDPANPLFRSLHGNLFSVLQLSNHPSPPQPIPSPEIGMDNRATFRLKAPNARDVRLDGQWPDGHTAMTRDSSDVWSATVGPVPPGVWEYSFQVDGLEMLDPDNPVTKPMRLPTVSIMQIGSRPPQPWDLQDVPHGTVHWHTYFSKSLGRFRELAVYTPPGYEKSSRKKFPVLYLQHGYGDNQETWIVHGKANWILDNLIAQHRAKPMLVVMMDGHALVPVSDPASNYLNQNTDLFQRDLLRDVIPLISKTYRIKRGPANAAIAGLSMGGGQALTIGLNHPDLFGWVAGFSAATPASGAIASALQNPARLDRDLRLLYIADGKDDFLLDRNEGFLALLDGYHIKYEWHLTEGDHSWPVWRNYLTILAPKLFR